MCGGERGLPYLTLRQRIPTEGERTDAQKVQPGERGFGPRAYSEGGTPVELNPEVGGAVPGEGANTFHACEVPKRNKPKENIN